MTHRLATNYAKNYCNRTLIVKVIVENVVTCFLGTQCSSGENVSGIFVEARGSATGLRRCRGKCCLHAIGRLCPTNRIMLSWSCG